MKCKRCKRRIKNEKATRLRKKPLCRRCFIKVKEIIKLRKNARREKQTLCKDKDK